MTEVGNKPVQRPLFYPIVLLAAYLTYLILEPFLAALTWAVLFGILFHGMQMRLAARIGPNRAAVVTTLVAGIVIVAPAIILVSALARSQVQTVMASAIYFFCLLLLSGFLYPREAGTAAIQWMTR